MKQKNRLSPRNPAAKAMQARIANAHVAVTSDTRPKIITPRKGKGSYCRNKSRQDGAFALVA